nr:unnamed protein product [Spirometra erinaceieuropaei]
MESIVNLYHPPYLHEIIRVVQQLFSGKAAGSDAIHAKIYNYGSPQLMDHLTGLFQDMWHQGEVLQDFKDAHNRGPIQTERKPPALRKSPRHLPAEHRRENLRSNSSQASEQPPRTRSSAEKPVRLLPSS